VECLTEVGNGHIRMDQRMGAAPSAITLAQTVVQPEVVRAQLHGLLEESYGFLTLSREAGRIY